MSAFVVGKPHVDYLMSAAILWDLVRGREADEVGAEIWAENVRSVAHRYGDCAADDLPGPVPTPEPAGYEFASPRRPVEPFQVLQAISCLEYQSCEAAVERLPEHARGTVRDADYGGREVPRYRRCHEYEACDWEIRD